MNPTLIFRLLVLALILIPGLGLADCRKPGAFCVGLVTDVGSINDKSFNQAAWEGVQQAAAKLGATVKYIETRDTKDYGNNIRLFADNGYSVIVTMGFGLGEATAQAAAKYPKIRFIGVDQFQAKSLANVAGLVFHEDRAGFMAGALAAMLTRTNTVAAVLGTDLVPPIKAFRRGFTAGARHVNPAVKVIASFHPGGLDTGFTDPEWGAVTAKQAIDQGADVVFAAGGTTGNGALVEVAGHRGRHCIGVDVDQWLTLPEARPCLVASALKQITPSVVDLIEKAKTGAFPSGNVYGAVALSSFHDFADRLDPQIAPRLAQIAADLATGTLTIPGGH